MAEDKGSPIADLLEFAWMRRLLGIGIGLAVAQHFTGVNTIVYYGTTVLEATGLGASASIVAAVMPKHVDHDARRRELAEAACPGAGLAYTRQIGRLRDRSGSARPRVGWRRAATW